MLAVCLLNLFWGLWSPSRGRFAACQSGVFEVLSVLVLVLILIRARCQAAYFTPGRVEFGCPGSRFLCCLLYVVCLFPGGSSATHPGDSPPTLPGDPPGEPPGNPPGDPPSDFPPATNLATHPASHPGIPPLLLSPSCGCKVLVLIVLGSVIVYCYCYRSSSLSIGISINNAFNICISVLL